MASPSKRLAKAAKDYKFSGPQTGNQEWQKWDLLPQIGQYMDPHCIVKMLIAGNSPYAENYMGDEGGFYDRAFIETNMLTNVLRSTDMPQMLKDRAGHEIPEAELDQEQENINQYISKLQQEIMHVLQIMENSEALGELMKCPTLQLMRERHGVRREDFELLFTFIHRLFQMGQYATAGEALVHYNQLVKVLDNDPEAQGIIPGQVPVGGGFQEGASAMEGPMGGFQAQGGPGNAGLAQKAGALNTFERQLSIKWGLLALFIIEEKWDLSAFAANQLDEMLDGSNMLKKELVRQRTWLMHWFLFVVLKIPEDKFDHPMVARAVENLMSEKYLSLMALEAPHMLRYAVAVFVLHKRLSGMRKDLLHVLQQDRDRYQDPVTEFLLSLYSEMDFDAAKDNLDKAVHEVIPLDFFLFEKREMFESSCRLAIFQTYCRIHKSVHIGTVAKKLGMDAGAAEGWIVDLIRSGKLEATIEESGAVDVAPEGREQDKESAAVMGVNTRVSFPKDEANTDVYKQVLERTRNMSYRLFLLQANAGAIVNKKDGYNITDIAPELSMHLNM